MNSAQSSPVVFQTAVLSAIRVVYFVSCRQFVNASLFSDLKSVVRQDNPLSTSSAADEGTDSPLLERYALERAEEGSSSLFADEEDDQQLLAASSNSNSNSPRSAALRRDSSASSKSSKAVRKQNEMFSKLATGLFCLSFSESAMLFTLVVFADLVNERARLLNWSISLMTVLCLIVFVIPLGACLLLTRRSRSSTSPKAFMVALVPFAAYLLAFWKFGSWLASKTVVEAERSLGFINVLLSRICVPGVVLIASLSGAGAINTAWESLQWRSISSQEPVSENQIVAAERSLYRIRLDLQQRIKSLEQAQALAEREAEASKSQSMFARWTSSQPAKSQVATLKLEATALQGLEQNMSRDVALLRKRKEMREMGRTLKGRLWLAMGTMLSIYCVWRIISASINIVFGLTQKRHHGQNSTDGSVEHSDSAASADVWSFLLVRLAKLLNVDIDVATWSRLIGLALIGGIILANTRSVLGSVSRVFKAASTGVSASFLLLFLAQLMAVYLLTSLVSLPDSPSSSTMALLDTLPSFNAFSRLFDIAFLLAAMTVLAGRWIEKKVRVEDNLTAQYSYS